MIYKRVDAQSNCGRIHRIRRTFESEQAANARWHLLRSCVIVVIFLLLPFHGVKVHRHINLPLALMKACIRPAHHNRRSEYPAIIVSSLTVRYRHPKRGMLLISPSTTTCSRKGYGVYDESVIRAFRSTVTDQSTAYPLLARAHHWLSVATANGKRYKARQGYLGRHATSFLNGLSFGVYWCYHNRQLLSVGQ